MLQLALSITQMDSLGQDNRKDVQANFPGHVMPLILVLVSMAPFHLLGQDDQKEMQYDILVM